MIILIPKEVMPVIYFNSKKDVLEAALKAAPADAWVGEFSGRDSVAAILKAFEAPSCHYILPVASFAGTEFGDTRDLIENHAHLNARITTLYGADKQLGALVFYSDPALWGLINGRFVAELTRRYGFYSPCPGCHAYFHLLRIPFAQRLGRVVISGERESHDGRVKLNQLPEVLDFYEARLKEAGIDLIHPIRHVADGRAVEALIGWDWKEGLSHPECTFSGNYRLADGRVDYDSEALGRYMNEFLKPASRLIAKTLSNGFDYDHRALAKAIKEIFE
jgi:hypothetical protein